MPPLLAHLALLGLLLLAVGSSATPNTCQHRADQPLMPIFHIIGNITGTGRTLSAEHINDVSAVVMHGGLYHIFHQCCGNHWDHVVSDDLIHWARLPSPLVPGQDPTGVKKSDWYDARGSWDGSLTLLPAEQSPTGKLLPLIVYDILEGKKPGGPQRLGAGAGLGDDPTLAIARGDPDDPYLFSWKKDVGNPLAFEGCPNITGQGCGTFFPSNVWKNGDHWNFLSFGERFETTDPSLHLWRQAAGPKFGPGCPDPHYSNGVPCTEPTHTPYTPQPIVAGGQWFTPIPNQVDGTPPDPKVAGNKMISFSNGWLWQLGTYDADTETWSQTVVNGTANPPGVTNNGGQDGAVQWGVGQFAGDRMLNLFWARGMGWGKFGGGLSLLREINFDPRLLGHSTGGLVANPIAELARLRNGTLANDSSVRLQPGVPHVLGSTAVDGSAASADIVATFTLPDDASTAASFGICVLSDPSTANVGIGVVVNVSAADGSTGQRTASAWIGLCGPATIWGNGYGHRTTGTFQIFKEEREVDFRVLCDRSIVEAFLMGGRAVFSASTNDAFPGSNNQTWDGDLRHGYPTAVQIFAGGVETIASAVAYAMGCGWVDEPWCAKPPCPGITPQGVGQLHHESPSSP